MPSDDGQRTGPISSSQWDSCWGGSCTATPGRRWQFRGGSTTATPTPLKTDRPWGNEHADHSRRGRGSSAGYPGRGGREQDSVPPTFSRRTRPPRKKGELSPVLAAYERAGQTVDGGWLLDRHFVGGQSDEPPAPYFEGSGRSNGLGGSAGGDFFLRSNSFFRC
jgi:hypothetical protein